MNYSVTSPAKVDCRVQLPPSKSMAIRALLLDALCDGKAEDSLHLAEQPNASGDIEVMARALACTGEQVNVGGTGAAMRFLTAYFATRRGRTVVLDGDKRMRQRPIGMLVDALRQMGAEVQYLGNEGFPPLRITGHHLTGGTVHIDGSVSSQYISALLMIAPLAGGVTLMLDGNVVSRPYIDMTLAMMRKRGVEAHWHEGEIVVPSGSYKSLPMSQEGDWSAASYWFAMKALLPDSAIVLLGLNRDSIQGDRAIVEMMKPLGVIASWNDGVLSLERTDVELPQLYSRDMSDTPDLVPTLAVTLCLLHVPYELTGVANLAIKESNRLEALQEQMLLLGYEIESDGATLRYDGNHTAVTGEVTLDSHGDHRMAMALSLASTRHASITIADAQVVTKSYPRWWEHLACAGFEMSDMRSQISDMRDETPDL